MQALVAAARQRLAAFDLRKEEALADQHADRGQQRRQAAGRLHGRIEIQLRMPPIRPAWHGPAIGRQHALLERDAQHLQPVGWNRLAKQGIAVALECVAIDHGQKSARISRR